MLTLVACHTPTLSDKHESRVIAQPTQTEFDRSLLVRPAHFLFVHSGSKPSLLMSIAFHFLYLFTCVKASRSRREGPGHVTFGMLVIQ